MRKNFIKVMAGLLIAAAVGLAGCGGGGGSSTTTSGGGGGSNASTSTTGGSSQIVAKQANITNTWGTTQSFQSFDFTADTTVKNTVQGSLNGDFTLGHGNNDALVIVGKAANGVLDLGVNSINNINSVATTGYSSFQPAQTGHSYSIHLPNGNYAVIEVTAIDNLGGSDVRLRFNYKYQPNGTTTF